MIDQEKIKKKIKKLYESMLLRAEKKRGSKKTIKNIGYWMKDIYELYRLKSKLK